MKYDWKCLLVLIPVIICAVIIVMDKNEPQQLPISVATETERENYLLSLGWEGKQIDSQTITIPEVIQTKIISCTIPCNNSNIYPLPIIWEMKLSLLHMN